jgi:metal-responsive CopG/Arc/MetJ family transcriptional regulator
MSTKDKNQPSHLITLWAPSSLVAAIDAHAKRKDTDRSKWIREAMREKAARERATK